MRPNSSRSALAQSDSRSKVLQEPIFCFLDRTSQDLCEVVVEKFTAGLHFLGRQILVIAPAVGDTSLWLHHVLAHLLLPLSGLECTHTKFCVTVFVGQMWKKSFPAGFQ